jgi:AraC-like DNA-binding protein
MRLAMLRPACDLRDLVAGYCLCDDTESVYAGDTISTAPQLGACICVQLGGNVITDFRDAKPMISYAGVQSRIRCYRPEEQARSLVIFLTPLGSIRFLPSNGQELCDEGYEIGSMIGDGEALRLRAAATAALTDASLATCIDAWLWRLFERQAERSEFLRLAEAMRQIGPGWRPVTSVAQTLGLSERHLERSFQEHLGLSPKRYQLIHRVTRSLQAELTGKGDPLEGFSDQAHQIRNWQTYLGFTPGQMRRAGASPLGLMFQRQASNLPADWAHYI